MKTPIRRRTKTWDRFNKHHHFLLHSQLLDLGARVSAGGWHKYYIDTKHGKLGITPIDDWIATAFSEPKRAYEDLKLSYYPPVNSHNGKWNFHGENAKETLDWFISCLKEII